MTSSSDRWQRLQALFYGALELKTEDRDEFLEKSSAGDTELRKEVEDLLQAVEKPMDFLQRPVLDAAHQIMAEKRRESITPGTRLGHYEIISLLGAGGMGEVYLAEDTLLRRKVALKMLNPELTRDQRNLRRFEQEALAASALNHPNILTIYEFGEADGLRFIASEYVEGQTLRLKAMSGRMEMGALVDISMQIASALAAAHASGIVHRDIKPENVIIRNDGIAKVLDFGIAKLSGPGETIAGSAVTSSISKPGMVMGTAKYMSPEQARGLEVDSRSDIFCLGVVVYELVTGRQPFNGATTSDIIAEILKAEPAPPVEFVPDVPYEIERIISKAMRKDRDTRYQSVKEMLIDLQDFKNESAFQARLQISTPRRAGRTGWGSTTPPGPVRAHSDSQLIEIPTPARRWQAPVVLLLVIAAALGGYYWEKKSRLATSPAGPRPRTLAILPFRNLKQDPETDFLGFSLADEIITKLGYVNSLTIRPSSSIDKYRNQVIDAKKVAADLDVDTLLTGSFLKDGNQLRITTQLIDVRSDKILWRDSINLTYDKLLTVQDQVSEQIIKGLELNLSPTEAANIKPEKPINAAAYEDYLRGIDLYSLNEFKAAIGALEEATTLEPNYAPAWAHLGRAYTTNASLEFGGREGYVKAQSAYERAIRLNPALIEPRIYMANLFTDTGRVEQAVPLLRSVLQDSPNSAEAHWELGYAYRFAGMLPESVAECEKARQIDPQVKINSSALNSYLYLGEYGKFLQSLPANDNVYVTFYRGLGEYYENNLPQAARDFDRAFEKDSTSFPASVGKALSYSIRREDSQGLQLLRQTESKIEEFGVSDAEGIYKVAQAFAALGDKQSALHMLRHAIGGGFFCYPYFERDPLLEQVRNDPEFQALMKQALERHEQFKSTFFSQVGQ